MRGISLEHDVTKVNSKVKGRRMHLNSFPQQATSKPEEIDEYKYWVRVSCLLMLLCIVNVVVSFAFVVFLGGWGWIIFVSFFGWWGGGGGGVVLFGFCLFVSLFLCPVLVWSCTHSRVQLPTYGCYRGFFVSGFLFVCFGVVFFFGGGVVFCFVLLVVVVVVCLLGFVVVVF